MNKIKGILAGFTALFLAPAMASLSFAAPRHVAVQLKWAHQSQFAGFYMAEEKGYFAQEGLLVDLVPGGPQVDQMKALTEGRADFAVLAPENIIIKRSQGVEVKAIAAIYRRSAVVYASLPDSGIIRPRDFLGKTVAAVGKYGSIVDFEFQLKAMMKNLGLDMSQIKLVPYDAQYTGFCEGQVDVTAAYMTGGVMKMKKRGIHPNLIWPGDYRVRFYSDTLATTDQLAAQNPDLVTRFLRASLKGWRAVVDDPEKAVDTVMKYAQIKDRALQSNMLEAMLPLVHTGEDIIGWMKPRDWAHMHRILVDQKIIDAPLSSVDQIFTLQFLEAVKKDMAP